MGKKSKSMVVKPKIEEPVQEESAVSYWNPFSGIIESWFGKAEPDVDLNKFANDFENFQKKYIFKKF